MNNRAEPNSDFSTQRGLESGLAQPICQWELMYPNPIKAVVLFAYQQCLSSQQCSSRHCYPDTSLSLSNPKDTTNNTSCSSYPSLQNPNLLHYVTSTLPDDEPEGAVKLVSSASAVASATRRDSNTSAGSYVMDSQELRRITSHLGINASDTVILVGIRISNLFKGCCTQALMCNC